MKDVVIQEGGESVTLENVRKLLTDTPQGGSVSWLPEDEIIGLVASFVGHTMTLSGNAVEVNNNTVVITGGSE